MAKSQELPGALLAPSAAKKSCAYGSGFGQTQPPFLKLKDGPLYQTVLSLHEWVHYKTVSSPHTKIRHGINPDKECSSVHKSMVPFIDGGG